MKSKQQFYTKILENFDRLSHDEIKRVFTQLSDLYNTQLLVAENLEEGVIAINNEEQILFLNKKAIFFLNITQDIEGKNLDECISSDSFAYIIVELSKSKTTIENTILQDKNSGRILQINILPLGHEGRIEGSLILIFDITNLWLQSQKLKRVEQLASLTTVVASVAHEIKNPLGSISIYIQLIEKILNRLEIDKNNSEELHQYCSIVKEEINRLEDTVNSFLFSVRTINLNLEEHDICKIMTNTVTFLQHEIKESNIKIEINSKEEHINMMLDIKFIKQAFINIIQNSIDALKNKKNKNIKINLHKDNSNVFIYILDDGYGIKKANISKVFEPYFTTKDNGTGLGLTNVMRIIEAHNGTMEISSEQNIGTEVLIKLPIMSMDKKLVSVK